ncbi:dethiobiotin synthase [Cupriavidus pinatubonensis]|uniref:ATP-dependent dethiobiotin synthetase BioD n=1 Tax=Cupriavidus pinatubonensis TaxID=248026 RepID=A0ABN7Z9W2_9BURK|nr:dethiobiotin synthase [Cupriavidus pinatubonensis]CAG9181973.1 ATP-dependent dethiobiotin synthetase BioD 1 [Cupriavidus pinatubonensis]
MNRINQPARFQCFVTGTDTGVGKTHASATLLHALHAAGYAAVGMKPVASGSEWRVDHWHNDDVAALRAASSVAVPLGQTCPFLLRTPCSPHLAAAQEGVRITRAPIRHAFDALREQADAVVVEGVGGFHVPLDTGAVRWSTADLAAMLALPVVMVVGIRLGCLNHAVLTAEAIRACGLTLAGWIANRVDPDMLLADENIATLHDALDAPCLGELPWQLAPADAAARLDLGLLFAHSLQYRAEARSLAA